MQILINFDEQLLVDWDRKDNNLSFNITWYCDGRYYPEKYWIDFGLVIIGFWFTAIDRLWQGSQEEEFAFMEGPYSIKALQRQEEDIVELLPEGLGIIWRVSLTELSDEIIRVAKETCNNLAHVEGGESFRVAYEKAIARLESNIQQARLKRA